MHVGKMRFLWLSTSAMACVIAMSVEEPTLARGLGRRETKVGVTAPAIRILPTWELSEGIFNKMPTRGFDGKIVFIEQVKNDEERPVNVDGDVRIDLFDDQGTMEAQSTPIHRFGYARGAWRLQLSKEMPTPTYKVFIPYTQKGVHRAKCKLRVRFSPAAGGNPVHSQMMTVELPPIE